MATEEVKGTAQRPNQAPKYPKREGLLDPDVIAKKIVDSALAEDEPKGKSKRRR